MKQTTIKPLKPEFSFAGFSFPKYAFTLPKGSKAKRIEQARNHVCGPYFHAPQPDKSAGLSFYLESDFMPGLRWQWCDEVSGIGRAINHTGWYCDSYQDQKIRGLVFRLPRSRGFLAGWSMGEGMCGEVGKEIYETEREAALAADSEAESLAEKERERAEKEEQEEREREEEEIAKAAEELEPA